MVMVGSSMVPSATVQAPSLLIGAGHGQQSMLKLTPKLMLLTSTRADEKFLTFL